MAKLVSATSAGFCAAKHEGELCGMPIVELTYENMSGDVVKGIWTTLCHDDGSFDKAWQVKDAVPSVVVPGVTE